MPWDEQLQRLTESVEDIFGNDVFSGAVIRAIAIATIKKPVFESAGDSETSVVDREEFYDVLRSELQRLVRPH